MGGVIGRMDVEGPPQLALDHVQTYILKLDYNVNIYPCWWPGPGSARQAQGPPQQGLGGADRQGATTLLVRCIARFLSENESIKPAASSGGGEIRANRQGAKRRGGTDIR